MADAADDHIVEIDDLSFSRGERRIFADLDMKIRRKEITAIMARAVRARPHYCG